VVGELHASARKYSHTDGNQTLKHFPLLIINYERLEQTFKPLLPTGKGGAVSKQLMLRSVAMALTIFNPDVGMRLIVAELIIVQMTICRVLCEQLLYPYCMQQVQGHKPADSAAGEALCQCSTHLK
jgi:hypothetical protein